MLCMLVFIEPPASMRDRDKDWPKEKVVVGNRSAVVTMVVRAVPAGARRARRHG